MTVIIPGSNSSIVGIPFVWDILTTMINTVREILDAEESLILWLMFLHVEKKCA